jgi:glycosyltransferase involved in cell wall biosynthesis
MNYLVRQYGYEVWMITSDQGQHEVPYDIDERVHFIDLNIRFYTRFRYKLLHRLIEYRRLSRLYHNRLQKQFMLIRPDIIVCTTIQDIKSLLKIKGDIPLVVESHINFMHIDTLLHRIQMWMNNYWIGKAETVVTLTNGDAEDWRRVSNHVHVIPNLVNLNDSNQYSDCTAKRVLFVGRFEEQKNIGELISIWQQVHFKFPDWKLELYGDGTLWEKYKREADALNINIEVHKPSSEIMDVYCSCSILVLTSLFEPFGLVIPEAMSCGIPVASFEGDGPSSIITEGYDGYVVKNRSVEQMADTICFLIENKSLRKQIGHNAVVTSQRYSIAEIMPKWKSFYAEISRESDLCNSSIK